MAQLRRALPLLLISAVAKTAHACTVCDSQNGHALRAGLFNGHFLQTLFLVLAPVPVFAGLILALHWLMPDLHTGEEAAPASNSVCLPSAESLA